MCGPWAKDEASRSVKDSIVVVDQSRRSAESTFNDGIRIAHPERSDYLSHSRSVTTAERQRTRTPPWPATRVDGAVVDAV